MLERPRRSVNCPNGQVFPIRNPEGAALPNFQPQRMCVLGPRHFRKA